MTRLLLFFAFFLAVHHRGLCYDFGTEDNPCAPEPAGIDLPKRDGSNGYTIALEGHVNPTTYVPGKVYQVTLRSTPPVSFKGFFLIALRADDIERSAGTFRVLDNIQTEVQPGCPYAIKDHATMTKTRITVEWTAPPSGTGCVIFKATVIQRKKVWFMNDGDLTLQLCEGEDTNSNSNDESVECCACGSPKYKVTFEGMWSSRTHQDFPGGYGDHWSDLIGASHTRDYTIWEYGGMSTLGVKRVAELGSPIALEREIRAQGSNIKTVITAPGLWPAVGNMTALFRTNRTHNLVSVLTMLGPSPDWCVGISKVNLCTEDCGWEEMKVVDLTPWDAGTDSGITYRAPNAPTNPQEPIHAITSSFPAHARSPFHDPSGAPIPPLARIHLERIELRDTSCEELPNTGEDDLNLNHGGGGMMKKPPMMPPKTGMMNKGGDEEGPAGTMPPKQMPPKQMPPDQQVPVEQMPPKQMPPAEFVPKAGTCPHITADSLGICVEECSSDADCMKHLKCCSNGCGTVCSEPAPKPGSCPSVPADYFGICVDECSSDAECTGMEHLKCCSNGCGSVCMEPAPKPGMCPRMAADSFGTCIQECSLDTDCMKHLKCCSNGCGTVCSEPETEPTMPPKGKGAPKPGSCPRIAADSFGICVEECSLDTDCMKHLKCCTNGCGTVCSEPVTEPTMPPKQGRGGRPVIDCMMTEFGPWSECSRTCGKGTMVRKRMIKQKPKNGGTKCGKTKEKKKCQLERCPREEGDRDRGNRDCKMTRWGDWFPCTVTCGEGVQKRMRQVKRPARGNGRPCEPTLEERVCVNPLCE